DVATEERSHPDGRDEPPPITGSEDYTNGSADRQRANGDGERAQGERATNSDAGVGTAAPGPEIQCEPWWRDPATIPPREFLYSRHYIRKNISASIGAGGRLKTSSALFEAVEMAVGRNLTTGEPNPSGPLRALFLSGEEPQDELDRRVAAICQRYEITKT